MMRVDGLPAKTVICHEMNDMRLQKALLTCTTAACLLQMSPLPATGATAAGMEADLEWEGRTCGSIHASGAAAGIEALAAAESTGRLVGTELCGRCTSPGCVTMAAGTRRAGPMIVNLGYKR